MKLLKQDLKTGLLIAQAENLDDLWYLSQVIGEGDIVKARTTRLVKGKDDQLRADKGQKQTMTLSVKVEKAEFDQNANRLRVLGTIAAGPEDVPLGAHHTLEIDEHDSVELFKEKWAASDLKYIKDAEKAAKTARIMICVIGDGEATVALVRDRGLHYIDTKENIGGKYVEGREEKKKEFYSKLLKLLQEEAKKEGVQTVILGGPGFEKKNFVDYAKGQKIDITFQLVDTGNEGKGGVHEILKGGALEKTIGEARIAREAKLLEKLMAEIAKGGLAAYGKKEVAAAVEMGAVEVLLVLDKKLREDRSGVEVLIDKAKQMNAEFHILNSGFEPGQKLDGLGGVGALLRYRI